MHPTKSKAQPYFCTLRMLKNQTIQIKTWFLDILPIFIMIINAK